MSSNDYKSAVQKAIGVCEAVAKGDFESRILNITEEGEAGEMLWAINRLIDRSDAYIRESRASLEYVAANKYFRRIAEKGMTGAFGEASRTVNDAMDAMQNRVADFSGVVDDFELQMKEVVEAVASAAAQLQTSAKTMEQAANTVSEQSTGVAAAAEEASTNVNVVAAAAEELTASVGEINEQVANASRITTEAVSQVGRTNQDISGLARASDTIGEIVTLIAAIAKQTNLLALNATIEAARAGEAGKGFAVVASEVKGLASQTAKATEDISEQVGGIQAATDGAVTSIGEIGATVTQVNEIATAIAASVEEQSAATQEIACNVEQAASGTGEVSSSISQVSQSATETGETAARVRTASDDLAEKGEMLRGGVAHFLTEVRKVV
jgi:methyl-accepting chemotaxis protein